MLSRVASSLYWLGRYLERSECAGRFLWVTHGYAQELRGLSHLASDQCWQVAHRLILGEEAGEERRALTSHRIVFGSETPRSLISCVERARENARVVRDAIPSELWEELNILYLRMQGEQGQHPEEATQLSLLRRVLNMVHLYHGLRDSAMLRADEWLFLTLGGHVERGSMTPGMLGAMFQHPALQEVTAEGPVFDTMHLTAILRTCSGMEAFSRAGHSLSAAAVAGFLLLDSRFPRSVEFCVQEIGRNLHTLSGTPQDVFSSEAEQLSGRLLAELRFASIDEVMARGLTDYLDDIVLRQAQISAAVQGQYFP